MKHLSENRLIEGLSEAQLRSFQDAGEELTIGPGEIIIHEGQMNTHLYLVEDGALEVVLPETDTRLSEIGLAVLGEGEYAGEYGFLDSTPASATVRAAGNAHLFRMRYADLRHLIETEPDVGRLLYRNLLLQLVKRLRQANDELDLFKAFS